MNKSSFALFGTLLIVNGCGFVQRHQASQIVAPDNYFHSHIQAEFRDDAWWTDFGDDGLNQFMDEAINNSPSLEAALARLQQFRALSVSARSSLFPTVTASGSYQDGERAFGGIGKISLDYYDVNAVAQYEIDLWGKLSAQRRAAYGDLLASENDARTALLTLTSQVARTYFQIVDLKEQQRLIEQTVVANQSAFDLVSNRYVLGIVTTLDVYQAEANLAQTRAQAASIEAALTTTNHLFSLLLGRYPETNILGIASSLPIQSDESATGIPSQLLNQRPDVQAARARLLASDARWASANAALLPSFSLTGTVGNVNKDFEKALDPEEMLWNLVAGLTAPIFQGGRLASDAQRNEAAFFESAANYKQIALNAYREVEDALVKGIKLRERITQLEKQSEAAGNLLRVADDQYRQGIIGYLQVLVVQNSYYQAQSALISARREMINNRVDLATALGGSWTDEVLRSRTPSPKLHTEVQ